jgi:hypothetical protein
MALYRAAHVLEIDDLKVNDGAIAAVGDSGVHAVAYVGDASGDGAYTALDVEQINRLTPKRPLDTGFAAYRLVDPALIADVNGNGTVDKADAKTVERLTRPGGSAPAIPPIPALAAVTASAPALAASLPGVADSPSAWSGAVDESSRALPAVPAIDWNGLFGSAARALARNGLALPWSPGDLLGTILEGLDDGALDGASRASRQVLPDARPVDWDGRPEWGDTAVALIEIPATITWDVEPASVAPELTVPGPGAIDWDGHRAVAAKPRAVVKAPKPARNPTAAPAARVDGDGGEGRCRS